MTLIVPSGDGSGGTDLAHINAMGPNDELAVGTFYINGPITATVIRGVDQAHWEYLSPAALTLIVVLPGIYPDGAAIVNGFQGF